MVKANASETEKASFAIERVGHIAPDDLQLYLRREVYDAIRAFSAADSYDQQASVLLGYPTKQDGQLFLNISDFLDARDTESTPLSVVFTEKTLADIRKRKENFPALSIVGWHRTQPGMDVFLCERDIFLQTTLFPEPFQVIYILDPLTHEESFFQWKDGALLPLFGFYLYSFAAG